MCFNDRFTSSPPNNLIHKKRNSKKTSQISPFSPPSTLFPPPPTAHNLCILIRTSPSQTHTLPLLLRSLLIPPLPSNLSISLTIVDTDFNFTTSQNFYTSITQQINLIPLTPQKRVSFYPKSFTYDNIYGYSTTSYVLPTLQNCTYNLITNGDNYYLPQFLTRIGSEIEKKRKFIMYDFLSHHPRQSNVIHVKLERQYIDLGKNN